MELIREHLALHKFVRLRHRYILTRNNRVRLRYAAATAVCLVTGLATIFGSSGVSSAFVTGGVQEDPSHIASLRYKEEPPPPLRDEDIRQLADSFISTFSKAPPVIKGPVLPRERNIEMGAGDTLTEVLQTAGATAAEAYKAVQALSDHYDPRKMKAGQILKLRFDPDDNEVLALSEVKMKIDPLREVTVMKQGPEEFKAEVEEKEVKAKPQAAYAKIETSLYGSALKAGIPAPIVAEIIRVYSWNMDFQRDIRQGDKIEVMYDAYETDDGDVVRYGDVVYANLSVGGKEKPIYRYKMANGDTDYFEEDGRSTRKTLMKTPIDGARLSSGFGMRHHPILGYNKMHKGLDFAASVGTPVYAAGDGKVELAGRKGAYGNYVSIRHNSNLKTAYAHLLKFAKGVSTGSRVKQGQVIAYVGTTGRSTGPHLHYEVLLDGVQVNPKRVDLPTGEELVGKDKQRFKGMVASLKKQYLALAGGMKVAQRDGGAPDQKDIH